VNSTILVDESQGAPYDSLDPQYAFYQQDTAMLNAVYQNLVELNGTSGSSFQYVLADGVNVNLNGGATNAFHIRSGVWFSNGDRFSSYDVWFTIERNLFMNAPSTIAGFNWNAIIYNITTNSGPYVQADEYSDNYCWNAAGLGLTAGVADAIAHVTGLNTNSETKASCALAASVMTQMLSSFNPSNATQAAIMTYPNQAVVAPNATSFIANYLHPLGTFGLELWSGFDGQNVVDPAFVDAHGGVMNNTVNSYINTHGAVGTGPYEILSVGAALTPVVFGATPNYWGASNPGITGNTSMTDAQPAKISTVIYDVAPTDTALIEDFVTNKVQLSYESIQEYGQMYTAFHAKEPSYSFNQIHCNCGPWPFTSWFVMNQNIAPTNNTDFRLGWEYAINYTQLDLPNYYNGQPYMTYFVPPLTPAFGSFYNPGNLTVAVQDTTKAFNYFNLAGMAQHWYTVVPSSLVLSNGTTVKPGTILGDPNGRLLSAIGIYYTTPLASELKEQIQGIQQDLGVFGISLSPYSVVAGEELTQNASSPTQTFPQIETLGWGPDYEDPFLSMFSQLLPPSQFNGWFTNSTTSAQNPAQAAQLFQSSTVGKELSQCQFPATASAANACDATLTSYTVENAIFLPFPDQPYYYFFVQPYVQGFVNNPYVGYWYNQVYYTSQPS
jgi:ABC-type transport system substrate-binding protein